MSRLLSYAFDVNPNQQYTFAFDVEYSGIGQGGVTCSVYDGLHGNVLISLPATVTMGQWTHAEVVFESQSAVYCYISCASSNTVQFSLDNFAVY
jgi:hypothetical protein